MEHKLNAATDAIARPFWDGWDVTTVTALITRVASGRHVWIDYSDTTQPGALAREVAKAAKEITGRDAAVRYRNGGVQVFG